MVRRRAGERGAQGQLRVKLVWALGLALAFAGAGVAVLWPDLPKRGLDRATATLAPILSDPLGSVIDRPIRVHLDPEITIVSGRISAASALEGFVSEALASPNAARKLVLTAPVIVVRASAGQDAVSRIDEDSRGLANLLANRSIESVRIEGATLRLVGAIGRDIELKSVNALVDLTGDRDVAHITGGIELMGQPLGFDLSLDTRSVAGTATGRRVSLRLSGTGIDGAFEGSFDYRDGLQQSGIASLQVADLAALLERVGIGTGRAVALGRVHLEGGLTLSNGTFALAATRIGTPTSDASGAISIRLDTERSVVDGTLDFETLDVAGLGSLLLGGSSMQGPGGAGRLPAMLDELGDIDADLRVSADRVVLGAHEAGPLAATVTVRRGSLSGDLAELSLFGGEAKGQFSIASDDAKGRIALSGSASGLQFSREAAVLLGIDPGSASRIDLKAGIEADGGSLESLLGSLDGRIGIELSGGGTISGDGLLAAAARRIDEGLRMQTLGAAIPGRPLSVDRIKADLSFDKGRATIGSLELDLAGEALAGAGTADLAARTLDIRVWPQQADAPGASPPGALNVSGPWRSPAVTPAAKPVPDAGTGGQTGGD
jgi:AsmA protein